MCNRSFYLEACIYAFFSFFIIYGMKYELMSYQIIDSSPKEVVGINKERCVASNWIDFEVLDLNSGRVLCDGEQVVYSKNIFIDFDFSRLELILTNPVFLIIVALNIFSLFLRSLL